MDVSVFCTRYLGKRVDFDGAYGAQCVDLFRQYAKDVWGLPHTGVVEGAKDLFLKYNELPLEQQYLIKVESPAFGDVVVFNASANNQYGHVAIFIAQDGDNMLLFEQDGFEQSGAKYMWRSTRNLLGVLRKKQCLM